MDRRYLLLAAIALGVAGATACSGPPPGLISFSEAGVTASDDDEDEDEDDGDTRPRTANTGAVNAVFADEVYPAVETACGSCHFAGTGGAPVFFGKDAASTYELFKERDYHLEDSLFVTKGQHSGPALTTEQQAAIDEWVADEAE